MKEILFRVSDQRRPVEITLASQLALVVLENELSPNIA